MSDQLSRMMMPVVRIRQTGPSSCRYSNFASCDGCQPVRFIAGTYGIHGRAVVLESITEPACSAPASFFSSVLVSKHKGIRDKASPAEVVHQLYSRVGGIKARERMVLGSVSILCSHAACQYWTQMETGTKQPLYPQIMGRAERLRMHALKCLPVTERLTMAGKRRLLD